jgi:uncharacterized protein YcfJ
MKRVALLAMLAAGFGAAQADTFVDNARVRAVEPQYQAVQVPREECRSEYVTEARPVAAPPQQQGPNMGGIAIGAVVGGLLGNQVGKGHGREAATAVGAVAGAMVGNSVANSNANAQPLPPQQVVQEQREVRSCRQVVDMQQRLTGYRVTYEYRGREYTTITQREPGNVIPVQVSVNPVEAGYHPR